MQIKELLTLEKNLFQLIEMLLIHKAEHQHFKVRLNSEISQFLGLIMLRFNKRD
jgi:hypothetical protein